MKNFKVEVWVVTSYHLTVEAPDAEAAEAEAKRMLSESHVRDAGGEYGDSWQDVMSAEETTR
jgi:hypothetical protein